MTVPSICSQEPLLLKVGLPVLNLNRWITPKLTGHRNYLAIFLSHWRQLFSCGEERQVLDYRGLGEIMVKNRYPLLLILLVFELLQGATIFTKLDLCIADQLVCTRGGMSGRQPLTLHSRVW